MAYVSRMLFLRSIYFRQCAGGIFTSSSNKQNLDFNSLMLSMIKGNIIQSCPRTCTSFKDYMSETKLVRKSRFYGIGLPTNSADVTEGELVTAFLKLTKICTKFENKPFYRKDLQNLKNSSHYQQYCSLLETKLPQMSPISLIILYEFMDFPGLTSNQLIDKICVMILEKINEFSVLDKIYIYIKVLKNYSQHKESNNIKKVCEVYFEQCFETDLSHLKYSKDLLQLLDLPQLPDRIKKLIVDKLMDDAQRKLCTQRDAVLMLEKFTSLRPDMVPKHKLKNFIEIYLYEYSSISLIIKITSAYRKLCEIDDLYFSKTVIDALVYKCMSVPHSTSSKIPIILDLCLMGYIDDNMMNFVVKSLYIHQMNWKSWLPLAFLNILVRSPFLDTFPEAEVNSVKKQLGLFNIKNIDVSFSQLCAFCEGLTYIGCDSRSLCSDIFKEVNQNFGVTVSERNVLSLHHLAKAYFSGGYEVLSEKTVDLLLEAEFKSGGAFPSENLNEYFVHENYVLKNCTTSDKHCLHFVTVFDPDNKPIDLSTYKKQQLISTEKFFNIEKIERRPGFKIIIFQKFNDPQPIHFFNRPEMSGAAKMYLKLFENLDCSVVLLPRNFFKFTPDKRAEFLSSQIKDIIENPKAEAAEG